MLHIWLGNANIEEEIFVKADSPLTFAFYQPTNQNEVCQHFFHSDWLVNKKPKTKASAKIPVNQP